MTPFQKKIGAFLILIISLSTIFAISTTVDTEVVFNDPNLEKEIRTLIDHFGKPIYQSQLMDLYELDLSSKQITDLSGIEHIRGLEILNLANNNIIDISPLASLKNLHILNLQKNGIIDLDNINFGAIKKLNLIELYLDENFIISEMGRPISFSNIEYISNFRNLEILSLNHNQVSDISPLKNLRKLRVLKLRGNQIYDIDSLEKLTRLEILDLSRNNIEDINTLKGLTNLRKLNLRNNKIVDISHLYNLKNLEYLNLHSNFNIKSVEVLSNFNQLTTLILRSVPIGDQVWVLSNLVKLNRLNVRNCQIKDFTVLEKLMASGALQDNKEKGIVATVNIRDNILIADGNDPLAGIKPYWDNITNHEPIFLPHVAGLLPSPVFSQQSGFFTEEFLLELTVENSEVDIYFTLDGSDPNPMHVFSPKSPYQKTYKYSEPILIKSRAGDDNIFSTINTTHVENKIPWMPPKSEVFKATVVRAIAYDHQKDIQSEIITHTFFVDENIHDFYNTIAVVSLTGDYDALFGSEYGIFNTGADDYPFYTPKNLVPANLEFFEKGGKEGFSGLYEIKLHGNTSVSNPQKGFHVIAHPWLGEGSIQYPIFQDSLSKANQLTEFRRFIVRGWGTAVNWEAFFSDAFHQTLLAHSDLDIQDYRPVVLFVNGEYWGLYELREAIKNREYFQSHYYNWEDVPLDILQLGTIDFIDEGDPSHWFALLEFVENNDVSDDNVYAYIQTQMDIENFLTYIVHCVFTGKKDWPTHNEAMWRPHREGGRWRWIQFDMDQGLRVSVDSQYDMVDHVINEEIRPHPLFIKLLANEAFKHLFFNTFADMSNTYFLTSVEVDHFLKMADELEPYISEHQERWQTDFDWQENKALALDRIKSRRSLRWRQMLKNFPELEGYFKVTLLTDTTMGTIAINSIEITSDTVGVTDPGFWQGDYFSHIPIRIRAIPNPGYQFVGWESSIDIDPELQEITISTSQDISLKAIFEPIRN